MKRLPGAPLAFVLNGFWFLELHKIALLIHLRSSHTDFARPVIADSLRPIHKMKLARKCVCRYICFYSFKLVVSKGKVLKLPGKGKVRDDYRGTYIGR
ncbi:hypothetical protein EV356DRAFT_172750 [Viridothelium virens]|uniref:Uncharacterized protein n=1 Tax=Viridothelium virens TaxID=1048519 RepID=A0A6A6H9H9_VIRVR|nr:hypothetical protein EV356DRAFT_172750 [Viridothelium virens]